MRDQFPDERLTLLFADTKTEDEDLYRFLPEAAANVLDAELVVTAEGRDIWEVFFDRRFLGNSRVDPCSSILKREWLRKWLNENCDPAHTTVYIGIDFYEIHRFDDAKHYWEPWTCRAPLTEPYTVSSELLQADAPTYLDKDDLLAWLAREGIELPALYTEGFSHNNCGGFCVKAGQAQFKQLLEKRPDRYAYHEKREQEFREFIGKDVAVMVTRKKADLQPGQKRRPITMTEFRERVEAGTDGTDPTDVGGCACFTPAADAYHGETE